MGPGERVIARLEDGHAIIYNSGNVVFRRPVDNDDFATVALDGTRATHRLGKFDVLELARLAFGSDAELLKGLANNMRHGHRFTDEDGTTDLRWINEEEPF